MSRLNRCSSGFYKFRRQKPMRLDSLQANTRTKSLHNYKELLKTTRPKDIEYKTEDKSDSPKQYYIPKQHKFYHELVGEIEIPQPKQFAFHKTNNHQEDRSKWKPSKSSHIQYFHDIANKHEAKEQFLDSLKFSLKELLHLKSNNFKIPRFLPKPYEGKYAREFLKACKSNDLDRIEFLLFRDKNLVLTCDSAQMTGLHWASLRGFLKLVQVLIENKAYIDSLDAVIVIQSKRTPLYLAAKAGHLEVVEELLGNNADASCISKENKQAIHVASDLFIIQLLKSVDKNS